MRPNGAIVAAFTGCFSIKLSVTQIHLRGGEGEEGLFEVKISMQKFIELFAQPIRHKADTPRNDKVTHETPTLIQFIDQTQLQLISTYSLSDKALQEFKSHE